LLAALLHLSCPAPTAQAPAPAAAPRIASRTQRLAASRTSPHAYGRAGDLVLFDDSGASLIVADTPDAPGHRPLRGAVLDVGMGPEDHADPLLYWRPGFSDAAGRMHVAMARSVSVTGECGKATFGIRIDARADDVALVTSICPEGAGGFRAITRVSGSASALPAGAMLADELHPGTSPALIDGEGNEWDGEHSTGFVALAEQGTAFAVQARGLRVVRNRTHIAAEVFTAPVSIRYPVGPEAERVLHVLSGDALDALDRVALSADAATRQLSVSWQGKSGATLSIEDASGRVLATGKLMAGTRSFRLPDGFGALASVRDETGVPAADAWPLSSGETVISAAPATRGTVSFHYADETGAGLPVHVVLRGLSGTPDPAPRAPAGSFAGGRSLYLTRGEATLSLAPGVYQVTASHGPAYTLLQTKIDVGPRKTAVASGTLRRVVDTAGWIAGDFHLHAAPSPDSPVPLEARVASLLCEGVEFAVATDHNRISDYNPLVHALGAEERLGTLPGVEVTSAPPPSWGHFNVFPLDAFSGADAGADRSPENAAPPYYDIAPRDMLAAARERGARVIQVNHARMQPSIGYFDLVHLDPRTGGADPSFSANFDAVEAYNGLYIETPDKVREGVRDLVALARRGLHPTATGNSDSHQLLYEEAGYPRTYVHLGESGDAPGHGPVLDALLRGETTVSSGPFVELAVEGRGIGSRVTLGAARSVRAHVRVSAPSWVPVEDVELWRNDQIFFRAAAGPPSDGVRFESDIDVPISEDTVLLAWASAETPLPDVLPYPHAHAVGFTGLVYIDADGDGLVTVPPGPARVEAPDAGASTDAQRD
jgi:hypothetical protein